MSNIVYLYNPFTFVYEGEGKLHSCQRTLKETGVIFYMPRANSTTIQPTLENYKTPYFNLETNEWELRDNKIQGIFYNIASGDKVDGILQKDELLYTMDEPFDKMEGDKMKYVDGIFGINYETGRNTLINGKWIFESKSEKRQIAELTTTLLAELEDKHKSSSQIHIKNGYKFTIYLYDDYGKEFIKLIEQSCSQINDYNSASDDSIKLIKYFIKFTKDSKQIQLSIEVLNWIWRYVFEEVLIYFKNNRQIYDALKLKIDFAASKEELEAIEIKFISNNGLSLDITKTMIKLLNSAKGIEDDYYRESFKSLDSDTGQYIYKLKKLNIPKRVVSALIYEASQPYPIFKIQDASEIIKDSLDVISNSFLKIE